MDWLKLFVVLVIYFLLYLKVTKCVKEELPANWCWCAYTKRILASPDKVYNQKNCGKSEIDFPKIVSFQS